jgi:S1-C subfamily serine protease
MRKRVWLTNFLIVVVVALAVALAATVIVGCDSDSTAQQEQTPSPAETVTPGGDGAAPATDSARIYEELRPSVVQILTSATVPGAFGGTPAEGLGSGFMIDDEGNILTNYHVVADATQIQVTLADGTTADAEIIGSDPGNDIALIRADLPSDQIKPAPLGDSDAVSIGEPVLAIGNPFGLEGTVTQGIVSGRDRTLSQTGQRPIRELIQTDAAINPGNSGGPLVDFDGNVIAINSAIENPTGENVFIGIGFAIPINTAKNVLPQLLAGETVTHARLGIAGRTLTESLAQALDLSIDTGVYVVEVDPSGAAGRAGVQGAEGAPSDPLSAPPGGDVIVRIDDTDVSTFEELADYIESKQVGDTVALHIVRDGEELTLEAQLQEWELP